MEEINGISFEDWAAACAHLANGSSEAEVLSTLGLELPIWQQTNELWMGKLGDLMTEDMNFATKYGEIFANPNVGKFANSNSKNQPKSIEELLEIVPDLDSYKQIFWQQSIASEQGIDPSTIIQEYGINLQEWGQLNMHFNSWMQEYMNSSYLESDPQEYKNRFDVISKIENKWEKYWKDFYKQDVANLGDDITF